jgi:hypothetical protein
MNAASHPAFRTQLVIPEQRELYDYWVNRCAGAGLPRRDDIKPSDFPRLLPAISLVDVEAGGRFKVRLAGTRLRDIYGREITGKYLQELGWGHKQDYWISAYKRVVDLSCPAQGIIRGPVRDNDHIVQFWLRLPLSNGAGDVTMILCYDAFVPLEKASLIAGGVQGETTRYLDIA